MSNKRKASGGRPGSRLTAAPVVKVAGQFAGLEDDDMDDWDDDDGEAFPMALRLGAVPGPGAARRLRKNPEQAAVVGRLVDSVRATEKAHEAVRENVLAARGLGVSWAVLGVSLGITAEGARKRYGQDL